MMMIVKQTPTLASAARDVPAKAALNATVSVRSLFNILS
jgi:hypothetical protein